MKVLYLSYDGLTDPLGGSQVMPYLARLSKLGHEISIISFEKPSKGKSAHEDVTRQCARHGLDWHPLRYHKRPPVLSTIWDMAAMRLQANRIFRTKGFEIVHCRSYLPSLVGLALKRRHGIRFIFDMRGFWPEERVEGGSWKLDNPLFRAVFLYFKRRERSFFAEADAVVCLTDAAREEMLARPAGERPVATPQVIPCCVDLDHFQLPATADRKEAREHLGIAPDARVLCYLGSLGGNYLLKEMLGFFMVYRDRYPEARFLFVTKEPARPIVETAAAMGIAGNQIIVRAADRNEVGRFLAAADHGIAFKRASLAQKACSPTKLGEMMALGIPVVANSRIGDVDTIIRDTGAGVIVERFDRETLRSAVNQLAHLQTPSDEIRSGAMRWFDLENGVSAYDRIYASLADSGLAD